MFRNVKPQGIRGELKIKTYTDFPEDVKAFGKVYIDGKEYKILSFRVGNDGAAYVGLRGIPDRNAAELFRGKKLEGDREDAPELADGQYYIVDILGCACDSVLNLWIREMPTILLSERWLMLPVQLKALVTERRIRIQLHIKHGAWRTRILLQRTITCPLELEIPG